MDKKFKNFALSKKNSVNFKDIAWIWIWIQIRIRIWIRIHFFPVRIQDPDPDPYQNKLDPKHWFIINVYSNSKLNVYPGYGWC